MKKIFLVFFSCFSLSFGGEIFEKFTEKIINSSGIKGKFQQETYLKNSEEPQTFKGILTAEKPDKIKIEYLTPLKQIIFVKGTKSIIYSPEEKQVVVSNLPENFIVVKVFKSFIKKESFKNIFLSVKEEKKENGFYFTFTPVDKSVKILSLSTDRKFNISRIKIIDKEGNRLFIIFSNFNYLKKPVGIDFNIPEGIEIIRY